MKSGNRLPDWLHELGKLANGLAGVPSSPTRQDRTDVLGTTDDQLERAGGDERPE